MCLYAPLLARWTARARRRQPSGPSDAPIAEETGDVRCDVAASTNARRGRVATSRARGHVRTCGHRRTAPPPDARALGRRCGSRLPGGRVKSPCRGVDSWLLAVPPMSGFSQTRFVE